MVINGNAQGSILVDKTTAAIPSGGVGNAVSADEAIGALAVIGSGGVLAAADAAGMPLSVPIPFQNKIVLIEHTRIAGTTHISGIDELAAQLEVGADLRLEREPTNMADEWAIKVFAGESRIGYVPADCNEILARLMDGGKVLSGKLTGKQKVGNWNKLHMEVSLDD